MSSMFMTSLGDDYYSSSDSEEEKPIQFIEEDQQQEQDGEDDFFISSPKSEKLEEEEGNDFFMTSLGDNNEESLEKEQKEQKEDIQEATPSNVIIEKQDIITQDSTPSIIFITPSHTPFELTKSNVQVPIDTIHPSWKNSIVNRSIEQQKLEQFKEKFNGKAKSIKFQKSIVEDVKEEDQVGINKSTDEIVEKKVDTEKMDTSSDSSSSSSSSEEDSDSSDDSSSDSSSEEEKKEEKKEIVIKGQDITEYKQALKEINQSKKQQRKQQMDTVLNKSSKHNKHNNRNSNPKKGGKKAIQKQQKMYREQLKKMPLKDIQFLGKKIKFDNTKKKETEQ